MLLVNAYYMVAQVMLPCLLYPITTNIHLGLVLLRPTVV